MKDISHVRNDLLDYFTEAVNEIMPVWYYAGFALEYLEPERFMNRIANAMADSAMFNKHGRWTAEPQLFERRLQERHPGISNHYIHNFCVEFLNWHNDYIRKRGKHYEYYLKKKSEIQQNQQIEQKDANEFDFEDD